jgi:hypothetical protein
MANTNETPPQQPGPAVDRPVVLRKAMEVLSVKGFAKASIADLTRAAGLGTTRSTRPSDPRTRFSSASRPAIVGPDRAWLALQDRVTRGIDDSNADSTSRKNDPEQLWIRGEK